MKSIKLFKLIGIVLLATTLSSCTSMTPKKIIKLPLSAQLSEKEVIDYYKKSLEFDTIATRNINVDKITYETSEVSEDKAAQLVGKVNSIEALLNQMNYTSTAETRKLLTDSNYHYIKAMLNDKKLYNPSVIATKEALGHYFIDVEYEIGPRTIGNLTPQATLLGLNGALTQDYTSNDIINKAYIKKSVSSINKYYTANGINKTITFDESSNRLASTGNEIMLEILNRMANGESSVALNDIDRIPKINTQEFNNIAGSAVTQSAYMPKLSLVYEVPQSEGALSGMGIYPSGDGGLKKFGYNRQQTNGKIIMRYVLKTSVTNSNELSGINVYPINYELESGINVNTGDITLPDFLLTELQKVIERSDRAIINTDLPALMSGKLYLDSGMAVLTGYESQYTNVMRHMSTIRRVIARNIEQNAYLLEVETLRQEGAIEADTYGTYRDNNYVVIEQLGDKFVITDTVTMTRKMTNEPSINPDSSISKRLVAMNLAGPVSEETKTHVKELLNNLYKAGTSRVLHGPKNITSNGKKVQIKIGMYDCFNSDTTLLSKSKKEYINATLREILVKLGVNVKSTYKGVVTEWIGGADNQVELITEEIVNYIGNNSATHMQVYYLVSSIGGKWVIDDMKIIQQEEKTGTELKEIIERISEK